MTLDVIARGFVFGKRARDRRPETRTVIHLSQMLEFVRDDVIDR